MATDRRLAQELQAKGYRISEVNLRPDDIVEMRLAMKRRRQRRVLNIERMTAREADVRLTEARENGWVPQRILGIGPERGIAARLGVRRALA